MCSNNSPCLLGTGMLWLNLMGSRKKYFPESHIMNPLLTNLVRLRWLDIGFVLFCEFIKILFICHFQYNCYLLLNILMYGEVTSRKRQAYSMDLDFVSVHKYAKKELGQYPATSHLVNYPHTSITTAGIPDHLARSGSQSQRRI